MRKDMFGVYPQVPAPTGRGTRRGHPRGGLVR
jgi:hypothetical protein